MHATCGYESNEGILESYILQFATFQATNVETLKHLEIQPDFVKEKGSETTLK